MKIQEHKLLGLNFTKEMQDNIFQMQKKIIDSNSSGEANEKYSREVKNLLLPQGNRNYLMSRPSLEIASKIKVDDEKFEGTMFKGLPVGKKITILINDKLFYRYEVVEGSILCIWVTTEPIMVGGEERLYMKYTTFRINTENGYISFPEEDPFKKDLFTNFLKYIIFLEFSELELVTLKPFAKFGTRKEGKYLNESKSDVVIVDSLWNKIVIRVGDFSVSGHLRFQPVGEGRQGRKLIYIKEFTKKGYVRGGNKNKIEGNEN